MLIPPMASSFASPRCGRSNVGFDDAVKQASALLVSGLFFRIWDCRISWPLLAQGAAILGTRLVINLGTEYNILRSEDVKMVQAAAYELVRQYPNLQLMTFVFAVTLSCWWISGAMALSFGLGTLGALTAELRQEAEENASKPALTSAAEQVD